jgi:hypothetical protein
MLNIKISHLKNNFLNTKSSTLQILQLKIAKMIIFWYVFSYLLCILQTSKTVLIILRVIAQGSRLDAFTQQLRKQSCLLCTSCKIFSQQIIERNAFQMHDWLNRYISKNHSNKLINCIHYFFYYYLLICFVLPFNFYYFMKKIAQIYTKKFQLNFWQ